MSVTLRTAFDDYTIYSGRKLSTLGRYAPMIKNDLADWQALRLDQLTPDMVHQRYIRFTLLSASKASMMVKTLRSVFAFARRHYSASLDDPTAELARLKLWDHLNSKEGRIKSEDMPRFYAALWKVPPRTRAWLLLLLLTGISRAEISKLEWSNVDIENKTFTYYYHVNRLAIMPMTEKVWELFIELRADADRSRFVFPGARINQHMDLTCKKYLTVANISGLNFSPIDLQRTHKLTAQELDYELHPIYPLPDTAAEASRQNLADEVSSARLQYQSIENQILWQAGVLTRKPRSPAPTRAQISGGSFPTGIRETCPTLREVWRDYLSIIKIKPKTRIQYVNRIELVVGDWLDIPINEIDKHMILKRHNIVSQRNGVYQADGAMRILRSVFKFAMNFYEASTGEPFVKTNPVHTLSALRQWHRNTRRTTALKKKDMSSWLAAVNELEEHAIQQMGLASTGDYLYFLLLTGCRSTEARELAWENVDLESGYVRFINTKNHTDHILPLSNYLWEMLRKRRKRVPADYTYVFPGKHRNRPMNDCRKTSQKIAERSGASFTPHDLRRTFANAANKLGIDGYRLKRLLNHSGAGDVTAGYLSLEPEDLRPLMQQITDLLLESAPPEKQPGIAAKLSLVRKGA